MGEQKIDRKQDDSGTNGDDGTRSETKTKEIEISRIISNNCNNNNFSVHR